MLVRDAHDEPSFAVEELGLNPRQSRSARLPIHLSAFSLQNAAPNSAQLRSWLLSFCMRFGIGGRRNGRSNRLTEERRNSAPLPYVTGHGFAFQISFAYCAIVRSLENAPEAAIFMTTLRAQTSGSA